MATSRPAGTQNGRFFWPDLAVGSQGEPLETDPHSCSGRERLVRARAMAETSAAFSAGGQNISVVCRELAERVANILLAGCLIRPLLVGVQVLPSRSVRFGTMCSLRLQTSSRPIRTRSWPRAARVQPRCAVRFWSPSSPQSACDCGQSRPPGQACTSSLSAACWSRRCVRVSWHSAPSSSGGCSPLRHCRRKIDSSSRRLHVGSRPPTCEAALGFSNRPTQGKVDQARKPGHRGQRLASERRQDDVRGSLLCMALPTVPRSLAFQRLGDVGAGAPSQCYWNLDKCSGKCYVNHC